MATIAASPGASPAPPPAERAALPVAQKGLLTVAVMAAMVMQILDSTIANVALPHMQTSLGATMDTVTWVLTSYIVASAIAIPITGWLAERIGSRNLFLWAVGGFVVTSALCGTAFSLEEMVLFRVLQGVAGAFIGPLSQTVMMDINPPSKQARAMAIWGMGVMVGPIMGPVLGGWLTENYNWRWVFYVNVPIGIATFALMWALLPSRAVVRRRFDLFGFSMLALGIAAFQLMLDRGQGEDWFNSWEIVLEGGVALAAMWVAVVHLATARNPLFDRRLFADRNLRVGMVMMLAVGMTAMAPMAMLPPMLQGLFDYPVIDTGLVLAPRGAGVLLTMALGARLAARGFDMRISIAFGSLVCAFSMWQMAHWSLDIAWQNVVTTGFIQGLGMGFVFMPVNAMAFATLAPEWRTDGASLVNLLRNIGASVGISVVTVLLAQNAQIAHEKLGASITRQSLSGFDPLQATRLGEQGAAALMAVNGEVTRQATMIAYLNDFYALAIVLALVAPLAFLFKRPKPGTKLETTVGE